MTQTQDSNFDGVAIIGMSGRFPGANSVEQFWQNLVNGVDSISRFTDDELEFSVAESGANSEGLRYLRARGVLPDVDKFDAAFFGIYPREAELMDPQHRLFLECAWQALEGAGYDPAAFPGLIGVFAGLSLNTYLLYNLCADRAFTAKFAAQFQVDNYQTLTGNDKDFLPTRVSYKLNLRGPSMAIQCACSTSLVAVCQACTNLLTYQCDMALAGGVSVSFPQKRDYLYQEESLVSADGTCRTFDSKAKGTVFGHGVGIALLKRLADAVQDGDNILAVIKGTAVNNDGSVKIGYAAPSVAAQAEVIAMAQAAAGVDPESISYVEAHGTGTPLGDPIEVAALTQAFRTGGARHNGYCALGSGKTCVGHLDAAAGATGLIKTVLQLQNELIPPLLHFQSPNPKIDFANSPFFPAAKPLEWKRGTTPRLAGVSAFGVGGTNAHVVVQEAPLLEPSGPSRQHQLMLVSARTPTALDTAAKKLASHIEQHPNINLADVAFTLHKGRRAFAHRLALVCENAAEAVALLRSGDSKRLFSAHPGERKPAVAFLFPGQGAQYVNMGRELYDQEPMFRAEVDRCAAILQQHLDFDIRQVLYPNPSSHAEADRKINETWITQPSIFVTEYALAKLWLSYGVKPSVLIGHSIGEYVCAVLAETFTLDDALALLSVRARLMQALPSGSMLAVRLGAQDMEPLLPPGTSIAALNSPTLCTVSGPTGALEQLQAELEEQKIVSKILATSHAFHSPMMEPMLPEFIVVAEKTHREAPKIRWISTCTGREINSKEIADAGYWARQLRHTVRFSEALETVIRDSQYVLLEVGPGQTLSQLARQHPARAADILILGSLGLTNEVGKDLSSLLSSLGRLWLAGVKPDWDGFYATEKRRRVPLPTYPFERKSYWVEPAKLPITDTTSPPACPATSSLPLSNLEAVCEGTPEVSANGAENVLMSITPPSPTTSASRENRLILEVRTLIRDLSGLAESDLSPAATFMELGFDSLFLTQASQAVQKKFGAKVTFRQMLDDLSSINALAVYLDKKLPQEVFPAETPKPAPASTPALVAQPQATTAPASSASTIIASMPVAGGLVERVLAQQMAIMQQQLELLRGASPTASPASCPPTVAAPIVSCSPTKPVVSQPAPKAGTHGGEGDLKRFGPFKGIEIGPRGGLTPRQEKALADLTSRYNRRTAGSKDYAQRHRSHFCDPRAAGNFRQQWKEMVYPIVCARSKGGKIWDTDGNEYVDVTLGFGANYFGHSPDFVVKAVEEQLQKGFEIGPQSPLAGDVAQRLCEMTGMERATFCNTGSEAVMAAMRVARTVTARDKIVYFTGDYHGIFDEVLARAGTVDGQTGALPIAPGIPRLPNMIVLDYGNPVALDIIRARADEIAAVMVEPVQSRHPDHQPREFLQALRQLTQEKDIALIFDEVVTGFRAAPGGAQEYFGVRADLATYGKVVGGGMPIGVLAGKRRFMDALDGGMWSFGDDSFPEVGVTFFAGTFVRHPLVMAAAHATLKHLQKSGPELQRQTTEKTAWFVRRLNDYFASIQVPIRLQTFSSVFFYDFHSDLKFASLLFYYLRDRGIHIWEGRVGQVCTAHTEEDLNRVIDAFKASVEEMQAGGFLPESPAETSHLSGGLPVLDEFPRIESAPLTEAQREIFLSVQMGNDANCSYNEATAIEFKGLLDISALEGAFLRLAVRHPALRSTFSADGERQLFHPAPVLLKLPVEDLSCQPETNRVFRYQALLAAETGTPFDLVCGPPIRLKVVRLENQRHVLLFTAHHTVCDGWSFGMLIAELASLYNGLVAGNVPMLPPPMPFGEFSRGLLRKSTSPEVRASEEYWLNVFREAVPTLELPTDHPRPSLKTYRAAMETRKISTERFAKLKKSTPALGGTIFSTLLATFATLLSRLTGQDDIVIGAPAAGQTMVGCNELVGHCLNLLPIRLRPGGEMSFASFAKSVRQAVLDAYDHQDLTYGSLIRKLNLPRDTSRLPLVSVIFNIDKSGFDLLRFKDLEFEVITNPKQFTNFELFFNLVQTDQTLEVECEYNTDLFDGSTIRAWLAAYEMIIEAAIHQSQLPLSRMPLMTAAECEELTMGFNQPVSSPGGRRIPLDGGATLHELFEAQATHTPEAVAVTCDDRSITYHQLNAAANIVARRLRAAQVGPDMLVGVCMERTEELIIALLGILKAGGAYLPIDLAYPAERLAFMMEDAGVPALLTLSKLKPSLPPTNTEVICVDALLGASLEHLEQTDLPSVSLPDQLAYVIYTSGTTGRPKGSLITHRNVVRLFSSTEHWFGFNESDVWTLFHSCAFDFSVWEIWGALLYGGRLVVVPFATSRAPDSFYRLLSQERVTVLNQTPSAFRMLMAAEESLGSIPLQLRYIVFGGEALDMRSLQPWFERHGDKHPQLVNMYGITETTVHVTYRPIGKADMKRGSVIGVPIPDLQLYILDSKQQPVPIGVPGELYVGGAGLCRGYLNRPELTAERFPEDFISRRSGARLYRTGDLARFTGDREIEYLGRIDTQVKIRGFRIEPGEIEAQLIRHPAVKQTVVVAREDAGSGQRKLVAYFVPSIWPPPGPEELRAHLAVSLPDFMVPTSFVPMAAIPLTPNGKTDYKALPVPVESQVSRAAACVEPESPSEKAIAGIWKEVLQRTEIGIDDDFFELGGDSLSVFRTVTRATQAGLPLTAADVFRLRTVRKTATAVDASNGSGSVMVGNSAVTSSIIPVDRTTVRRKR